MTSPIPPEGLRSGVHLPLSWQPSERTLGRTQIHVDSIENDVDDVALREYLAAVDSQYVITGYGVRAVDEMTGFDNRTYSFYPLVTTDTPGEIVLKNFKESLYGEPEENEESSSTLHLVDGLGGNTSHLTFVRTALIAQWAGMDKSEFTTLLKNRTAIRFGKVMVRSAHFLIDVEPYTASTYEISNIRELSQIGEELLEKALKFGEHIENIGNTLSK